jgi:hypothetical protein
MKTDQEKQSTGNSSVITEIGFERVVHYDKGITSDHVIASGSYSVNFDFAIESYNSESASNSKQIDVKKIMD